MPASFSTQGCALGEGGTVTPKGQEGATQGSALGHRGKVSILPIPQIVCLPRKEEV